MIIRHVKIQNFRRIRTLDWHIHSRFVVLAGPGDVGKTTVFEAIDLTIGRNWYAPTDADFHQGNPATPIIIEVTVGELPIVFRDLHQFAHCLRGWRNGVLLDEPETVDDMVITVRLTIDRTLEASWTLVSNQFPDGVPLRGRDRMKLGLHRLGTNVDYQLGWGKGSLLTKQSEATNEVREVFTEVSRDLRHGTSLAEIARIASAVDRVKTVAKRIGVPLVDLKAGINAADLTFAHALLTLHQADVPIQQLGSGSRRLLAIGMELDAIEHGSIGLIDEVEHGLEPYRIHALLAHMRDRQKTEAGQVFLTTHSSTVIADCEVKVLHVVRATADGTMTITAIPDTSPMQRMVRSTPEALLAPSVIVCEGKTEYGMCRGLDAAWTSSGKRSFGAAGCVPVNGAGNEKGAGIARDLRELGYRVCFFGDSDQPPQNPSWDALKQAGVDVIRWKDTWSVEDALFRAIPWPDVKAIVSDVIDREGISLTACAKDRDFSDVTAWNDAIEDVPDSADTRHALVFMSQLKKRDGTKKKSTSGEPTGWLKNIDAGTLVGSLIVKSLPSLEPSNDIAVKIAALRSWVDAG